MELEREPGLIRAVDEAKNTVRLAVPEFVEGEQTVSVRTALAAVDTGPPVPAESIAGVTTAIGFRSVFVKVIETDEMCRTNFSNGQRSLRLDDGEYLIRIDANVRAFVRFSGPAELVKTATDQKRLVFPEPTAVSIGFESEVESPTHEITVERSPAGAAAAVTHCSATTVNRSPDRTWPTQRNFPLAVTVGSDTEIPDEVRELRPETDCRLIVPPELQYVFVTAPLAQYLGAEVATEVGVEPRLDLAGETVRLGTLPRTEERVADILQRTFFLDCVARGAGPHGGDLSVGGVLDTLGLDARRLYEAPMAERVSTYLNADFESVRDQFPEWHLAMYVQPTMDHVETLPYLLHDLPLIRLPRSQELNKKDWLALSFEDGFEESPSDLLNRGVARVRREISNVDLVEPELTDAMAHGWMAEDVPIDVFKTMPEAYENRFDYLGREGCKLQVTAVVNERNLPLLLSEDEETRMKEEHETALEYYRERAEELPIDITVRENVTSHELRDIFESYNDFVHYIGHRDDRGLECSNGYFQMSSIAESNTQTFFLNACGSYPDGRELIKKGSVAGGITYEQVPDSAAAEVGITFARIMMRGFCIDRALRKASQQMMTPKDYAVVGDGTHVVTQTSDIVPPGFWLFEDDDEYQLIKRSDSPTLAGTEVKGGLDDQYHITGSGREYRLSKSELLEYLDRQDCPIVYDGELYWPNSISDSL